MKSIVISIMISCMIASLNSCTKEKVSGKNEDVENHRYSLSPFNGICIELDCNLRFSTIKSDTFYYGQDSLYIINIIAQDAIFKTIETPIIDGNLVIRLKENQHIKDYETISVEVVAPDISYLDMNGPGSVTINITDTNSRNYLDCTNSGSGTINLHYVNYSYMEVNLTGSGYIFSDSAGCVGKMNLLNAGTGRINFLNIKSDTVNTTITKAGDVSVKVLNYLNGTISGSGNIYYINAIDSVMPAIKSNITGSGSIIRL